MWASPLPPPGVRGLTRARTPGPGPEPRDPRHNASSRYPGRRAGHNPIRSRRIVWVLSLLSIVGMLVATGFLFARTRRANPAALDSAHAVYQAALQRCSPVGNPGSCQTNIRPADFLPEGTFGLVLLPQVFQHRAFIYIVIGLVIGSTSVGADWQSGSIGTLLTWEPRRFRLFTTGVRALAADVDPAQ